MMKRLSRAALIFGALFHAMCMTSSARADEKLRLVMDWHAQPPQGGYFQAVAAGLYKKRGLDVTIMQGGPGVNGSALVASGAVDMALVSNFYGALYFVEVGAPVRMIMASFQRDPQILMTHPRDDIHSLADMIGKPVMITDGSIDSYWIWLRATYGFKDTQIRRYTGGMAPWLIDPTAIQQGFVFAEPFLAISEGVKPQVYLLADNGYTSYSSMIGVRQSLIDSKPQVVQAFVDATIEGWKSYLYGDSTPALDLMKSMNPEITAELNSYTIEKMKEYQMVDSGDAKSLGIGAMTAKRWGDFFDQMVKAGVFPADLDYKKAFTLDFVDKGVGVTPSP